MYVITEMAGKNNYLSFYWFIETESSDVWGVMDKKDIIE